MVGVVGAAVLISETMRLAASNPKFTLWLPSV